jgi:dTDP-4-dehydrorhamnose reductase
LKERKTRVLVTGAGGMLGTDLVSALQEDGRFEVFPTDLDEMDVAATEEVFTTFRSVKPELVYHCAAYTDVDACETHEEDAFRTNWFGTWNVAAACASLDAVMVHISSDYVFDGSKGRPYVESDQPNPLSIYGKSKLAAERRVRELLRRFFIVRTSGLYGAHGRNFVVSILKAAREKTAVEVVDDQTCSTTYTRDLALALVELAESPLYGTYHLTNSGEVTRFGLAKVVLGKCGVNTRVLPITSAAWKAPAMRPAFSVLANSAWKMLGKRPLRPFISALDDFLREIGEIGQVRPRGK